MQVILLGTAAGGGFPQWNCSCPCCSTARADPELARPRTQSSVAISADGRHWFLLNASPDVREQLTRLPTIAESGTSSAGPRAVPVEAVVVTDPEIDHSMGIVLLREGRHLPLYATPATQAVLENDSHFLPVTRAFADVPVTNLSLDAAVPLRHRDGVESGLSVEAFSVPAGAPRFASEVADGHTVGLLIREHASGRTCAFVPGCGGLDQSLLARLADADILLFDGTFWTNREMIDLGIGDRTAIDMDHLPLGEPGGSLEHLAALPCQHKVFTHINNTNPMLLEHSPERSAVDEAGMRVGFDGLRISV